MRVLVLGSGAGGGVPQWNCSCPVCELAWRGDPRVRHRSQTSLAVSADGQDWIILDAAPELRQQIIDRPALHPRGPGRHSPVAAVILTSGDVDHLAGLLCLREGHRFSLLGTEATLSQVAPDTIFGVLRPDLVTRRMLRPGKPVECAGLTVTPFLVPGKVPLYRESGEVAVGIEGEDVIGLDLSDGARRLCYVPGLARLTPALRDRLGTADLLFIDGTAYADDELPRLGLSPKTAARMGHLAMTGEGGTLHAFASGAPARKVYIHLNNTNPVLIEDSPERASVAAAGWEVAYDGMEIAL
jgi:pyrroloquinoline quinone biosynthesis protein B